MDIRHPGKWEKGTVLERTGPLTYVVELGDGRIWKRHVDHLRQCSYEQKSLSGASVDPVVDSGVVSGSGDIHNPELPELELSSSDSVRVDSSKGSNIFRPTDASVEQNSES